MSRSIRLEIKYRVCERVSCMRQKEDKKEADDKMHVDTM